MKLLDKDSKIAVIGAGIMGRGIAQVAAKAGHKVIIYDTAQEALDKAKTLNEQDLSKLAQKGKITNEEKDKALSLLSHSAELKDLASTDFVIEAIVENIEIKQSVFKQLEKLNPNIVIASNTSSISISALACGLQNPHLVLGVHFFNPAPVMKLVEIIAGLQTDKDLLQSAYELVSSWGKKCVLANSSPGFIVNRVARPTYAEAFRLYEESVGNFATIDLAIKDGAGFRMGPFELMDLIGNDTNYLVTKSVFDSYYQDPRFKPSVTQYEYVNAGLLGRKTGRGFYEYKDGATIKDDINYIVCDTKAKKEKLTVYGDMPLMKTVWEQFVQNGIEVVYEKNTSIPQLSGYMQYKNAKIFLANGQMATQISHLCGEKNIAQIDISLHLETVQSYTIAISLLANPAIKKDIAELFASVDKKVIQIKDTPALALLRVVSMLINEASSAVTNGICDEESVDLSMINALNHKIGPFEWLEKLGVEYTLNALLHLEDFYKDGRYRPDRGLIEKNYLTTNS